MDSNMIAFGKQISGTIKRNRRIDFKKILCYLETLNIKMKKKVKFVRQSLKLVTWVIKALKL